MNVLNKIYVLLLSVVFMTVAQAIAVSKTDFSKLTNPLALIKPIRAIRAPKLVLNVGAQQCDATLFANCVASLAKDLGLPTIPSNAEELFLYLITTTLNQGLPGFEMICKATTNFESCLGDSFDICMSVQSLMGAGLSEDDATVYATLAQQMKYECGPGYQTFVDNFRCAEADLKRNIGKIVGCMQIFNSSDSDICKQTQQFTQCYTDIFKNCGSDFSTVMCESMKAGYDVSLPQCTIVCPKQTGALKHLLNLRFKK